MRKRRKSLGLVLPIPALDCKVLPFDPTQVSKTLKESFIAGHGGRGLIGSEKADVSEFSGCVLRFSSNTDAQEQNGQSCLDHRFDCSHLITLSALASTFGGIVR